MRIQSASLATAILAPLLAASCMAGSVSIGGHSKPGSGKLLEAVAGDVACYLDFEDAKGDRFSEMAEFEMCEQTALIGQWVSLDYRMGSVIADSCQGDPECADSVEVPLIHSMRTTTAHAALADDSADAADPVSESHCQPSEQVVFNCAIGSRLLSVCAVSAGTSAQLSAVEYRYGKFAQPLEMRLPSQPGLPNATVYGRTETYSGGGGAWIRFRNGNVAYVVYDGIGRWGADGATMEKNGVAIERNGSLLRNLACDSPPTSAFSPEFFERIGADPAGSDDFHFPDLGVAVEHFQMPSWSKAELR